jgi:hypothetical protein
MATFDLLTDLRPFQAGPGEWCVANYSQMRGDAPTLVECNLRTKDAALRRCLELRGEPDALVLRSPEEIANGVCPHGIIEARICATCTPPTTRFQAEPPLACTAPGRSRSEAARAGWSGRRRRDRIE